ncbi:hypothetical protein PMM47T1_12908 [Pseudomonas sp. M47T1]|uniref:hypothetical protein n=1 Tax=Pseudomonas sp. M47T1 TaxID=1179778 RepID=UPI000260789C|nr:hypothetical protein [Pseudomonas sp. M47T1]EIK96192.1 hypothetical protein PMM47T1_12908 [Pseudomonas sp. M47T1]
MDPLPLHIDFVEDTLFGPTPGHTTCNARVLPREQRDEPGFRLEVSGPGADALRKAHTLTFQVDQQHYHGIIRHRDHQADGWMLDIEAA